VPELAALRRVFDAEDRAIATLLRRDVVEVVRSLDTSDPRAATRALLALMPEIGERWAGPQAVAAADFYEDLRDYYGASGRYTPRVDVEVPVEAIRRNVRWATESIFSVDPDVQELMRRLSGSLERHVRDAGRDVVAENAMVDRATTGWRRVARPDACAWCVMLSTRWGDYSSKEAATAVGSGQAGRVRGSQPEASRYHDYCRCRAEAVFPGWQPDAQEQAWAQAYERAAVPGDPAATLANLRKELGTH
jgi:hypothetical protein